MPPKKRKRNPWHHRLLDTTRNALKRVWRWTTQADLLEEYQEHRIQRKAKLMEQKREREVRKKTNKIESLIDNLLLQRMPSPPELRALERIVEKYDSLIRGSGTGAYSLDSETRRHLQLRFRRGLENEIRKFYPDRIGSEYFSRARKLIDVERYATKYGAELMDELNSEEK